MGNVQIWFVGATPEEALDAEIFNTIDDAMDARAREKVDMYPGDLPLRIYSATVNLSGKDLAVRG